MKFQDYLAQLKQGKELQRAMGYLASDQTGTIVVIRGGECTSKSTFQYMMMKAGLDKNVYCDVPGERVTGKAFVSCNEWDPSVTQDKVVVIEFAVQTQDLVPNFYIEDEQEVVKWIEEGKALFEKEGF